MRYEELPGPLAGWTYDETGTIHTSSGYRCTARTLEFACWMLQCYGGEARRWMIHSDEYAGARRPLYETSDADEKQKKPSPGNKQAKATNAQMANRRLDGRTAQHEAVSALRAQARNTVPIRSM